MQRLCRVNAEVRRGYTDFFVVVTKENQEVLGILTILVIEVPLGNSSRFPDDSRYRFRGFTYDTVEDS